MAEKRMTQVEMFNLIAEVCADNEDIVEFCSGWVAKLEKKKAKAAERAAEKRAVGDELYAAVINSVGDSLVTAEEVLALFDNDDTLTLAKVRTRLSQGVQRGALEKESIKMEGGKSKVHYRRVMD